MLSSKTHIAIPPGATVQELIDDAGMSVETFADKMRMSEADVRALLSGDITLSTDIAERLESALGLSGRFWLTLESIYRDKVEKIRTENAEPGVDQPAETSR